MNADANRPLPPGLVRHRRQFRARRSSQHQWVYFGTDYPEACKGFAAWKERGGARQTMAWLLDYFTGVVCPGKVKAQQMKARTAKDYACDAEILKAAFPHHRIDQLTPSAIATFRDARAQDAPAHVRNEMACLSSAMRYAVEQDWIVRNPCREVRRPTRHVRERLISHDEYLAVHAKAGATARLAMLLAVRTLGLPEDVLALGPRNVVRYDDGRKTLRFRRGKTNMQVEVEIVGELAVALEPHLGTLHKTFVRRKDDRPYTRDGMAAMFRRYVIKAGVTDFGLRDLRAKGATDMWHAGVPLRTIQLLLGHASVRTTEIYLKKLLPEIVRPNEVPIIASVK